MARWSGAIVGVLLLSLISASAARALIMEVAGDQIILSNGVYAGDHGKFLAYLAENPGIKTVILKNSSGGDALAAAQIGGTIRERGLGTALSGYCVSACGRMFLTGVVRQYTSDQAPGRTYVGFHGNYDSNGFLNPKNIRELREWVYFYTDGKADKQLVERWTTIRNRSGMIYFFDPDILKRKDKISVFLCQGDEKKKMDDCEKIDGTNPFDAGIATSRTVLKVNKPDPIAKGSSSPADDPRRRQRSL